MNKSCEKKLEQILEGSVLSSSNKYFCRNRFTGEGMMLNHKEASVYGYILDAYQQYLDAVENKNSKAIHRAITDYDKSREVFMTMNNDAYYLLID
jgi:hypothetical protein